MGAVRDVIPGLASPVRAIPTDSGEEPQTGVALCLSGGGYRAMLFHLGVIWRLREAGWLERLDRVSSVSGGSITAAALALAPADDFEDAVVGRLRGLARRTLDWTSVVEGALLPGSIAQKLAGAYREHLFGDAVLGDLPKRPDFVINATNIGSGALARFERAGVRDWRVGSLPDPEIPLATAVACSSAFPPVLSPLPAAADGRLGRRGRQRPRHAGAPRRRCSSRTAASTTTSGSRPPGSAAAP